MAFGKKNKSQAPVAGKAGVNPHQSSLGVPKSKVTPSRVGILQATGVLVGALAIGLLLEFLLLRPFEGSVARSVLDARLNMQGQQLEKRIDHLSSLVRNFAREPSIVESIGNEEARVQAAEFFAHMLPSTEAVYLFPTGSIRQPESSVAPLSFASLDLVRTVQSRNEVLVDAFRRDGRWLFQIAAPVIGEGDQQARGSTLVVLSAAALIDTLEQPEGLSGRLSGRLSLVQRVDGTEALLLSQGAGSGETLSHALTVPNWFLRLETSLESRPGANRLIFWSVVSGVGFLAASLVYLLMQGLGRTLRRDVAVLNQWAQKAFVGERVRLQALSIGALTALGENLQSLAQLSDKRVTKAEAREAAQRAKVSTQRARHSAASDEPLFEENDVLDIDMLDGDQDILGLGGDKTASSKGVGLEDAMAVDVDIPSSIFRAYDIRGIVGETLTPEIVRFIGLAIGSEAANRGVTSVCVGYDGRDSSPALAGAVTKGLIEAGCDVVEVGRVPTPVLYFATHHLQNGSGVMITGSHNPANYNGLKMMLGGQTLAGEDIQKLLTRIHTSNFRHGQGSRSQQDVQQAYLDTILGDIAVAAPLKVVVDAGNGIAGELGPRLIEELGCEVVPLYCEVDGSFPNHHPDPGKPENLADLIERVKSEGADLGIAFDGDGDRLGVVTNTGKIIWADRLLMLFARDVVSRNPGADIIYDVKCSRRLATTINEFGGRPIMWKTGHSWMKAKMKESGALLAGEMSGHVYFAERWYGFDDGIYSAARLLEILGIEDRTTDEVFADFPEDFSTPEINLAATDEHKFGIIEKLAREGDFGDANINSIDGIRVDYFDGWGLCRASNTTPALVLRFEAESEEALERIKNIFRIQMQKVAPDVELNF